MAADFVLDGPNLRIFEEFQFTYGLWRGPFVEPDGWSPWTLGRGSCSPGGAQGWTGNLWFLHVVAASFLGPFLNLSATRAFNFRPSFPAGFEAGLRFGWSKMLPNCTDEGFRFET